MVQQESIRKQSASDGRKISKRASRVSLLRSRPFLRAARHCAADSPESTSALVSARWTGLVMLLCFCSGELARGQSSVTLAWTALTNSSVAGYKVYVGTANRAYSKSSAVGRVNQTAVTGLTASNTYYFAMTAYNVAGLESDFSPETRYAAGSSNVPPPVITLTLPLPGQTADIGTVAVPGGAGASGGTYMVVGAGSLSATADR